MSFGNNLNYQRHSIHANLLLTLVSLFLLTRMFLMQLEILFLTQVYGIH